ncbi:MAG: glycosyltransferase family 2 protein [Patescibacteria group bacterium]
MKQAFNWPKISIIVLTLNEEQYLTKCLQSVRRQKYPQKKIEIIVVDNGSTDDSVRIAKSFGAKVTVNKKGDVYGNWAIALHKATGDFTYMVDQDIELRGNKFFQKMLKPLIENKNIMASFTRKYPRKDQPSITRFISYHPAQCDPLYEFLTPSVEDSFISKNKGYIMCKFTLGKVPPFGRQFYRIDFLKKTQSWKQVRVFDHDLVIKSIKKGYDLFAYVPSAGLFHHHARNLKHLLNKRIRNLKMHYFPENETTEYRWLDVHNKKDVAKMILWIVYVNLIFPAFVRGVARALKHKDLVLLMEPIVALATTDVILFNFVVDKTGRSILTSSVRSLLGWNAVKKSKGAFGL